MKFSAAVASALALAPLSVAGQVHNEYPRELKKALNARAPESVGTRASRQGGVQMETSQSMNGGSQQSAGGTGESQMTGAQGSQGQEIGGQIGGQRQEQGALQGALGGNQGQAQVQAAPVIIIWTNQGGGAATQTVNEKAASTEGGGAAAASATTTIKVGGPGGLVYSPAINKFEVGSMVVWEFLSNNHTVTQSTFDKPCERMEGGFDTGFMPNPNNTVNPPPQVAMQVMTSEPLWFKCSQGKHCSQGMVASINAKDGEKSHAAFQELAIKSGGAGGNSTAPPGKEAGGKPEGGVGGAPEGGVGGAPEGATGGKPEGATGGMEGGSAGQPGSSGGIEGGMGGTGGRPEPGPERVEPSPERAESGAGAGGATGQIGAADSAGTVVKGRFQMVNGAMACVVSCGEGETSSAPKQAETAEAGSCSALCQPFGRD